jgi:hypothetical protein
MDKNYMKKHLLIALGLTLLVYAVTRLTPIWFEHPKKEIPVEIKVSASNDSYLEVELHAFEHLYEGLKRANLELVEIYNVDTLLSKDLNRGSTEFQLSLCAPGFTEVRLDYQILFKFDKALGQWSLVDTTIETITVSSVSQMLQPLAYEQQTI